ncbi:hypothetical protein HCN44_000760 [Aphidius gifuensis]|uniref:Uncharacterized protein n=1 Tax=Aphidius gifuensis TaxID=684658 RepID=A0A834XSB4_APHGI|nr:hypothetical protein HCN44_000760 [Aphidius gifuensis]
MAKGRKGKSPIRWGSKKMSELEFSNECFRCGRCVDKPSEHIWRWTAFLFGLDLVVYLDTTTLRIRRNHRLDTDHITINQRKRNVMIR